MGKVRNQLPVKLMPIEIMLGVLFLFAPFYYQPNWGGEGLIIPNNVVVWSVAFLIASYSFYRSTNKDTLALPKYYVFIASFPVFVIIAGFVTGVAEASQWFFRLAFIWIGLLFYTAMFQYNFKQARVDRLLFVIMLSAAIQALIGVAQVNQPQLIMSVWPAPSPPYGVFQQINNQASYQVTAIVIAIFLSTRPYINRGPAWRQLAVLIYLAIGTYIVTMSGSRVGVLSAVIAIPIMIIWRWKYLRKNSQLATAAALLFLLGAILGSNGLSVLLEKTTIISSGMSANARLGIYAVSLDLVAEKPFFGHGLGSFERVFHFGKGIFHVQNPDVSLIDLYVTHPHNEILFWLVEGGILAVVGMLLLSLGIYRSLTTVSKVNRIGYIAMLLPIALHTQVELPFYTSAIHWFLALFLLFVVMRHQSRAYSVKVSPEMRVLLRTTAALILVLGSFFFAHTFQAMYQINKMSLSREIWHLRFAENNPYFADMVSTMRMESTLIHAYSDEEALQEDLEPLLRWAEQHIKRKPTSQMFTYLAMTYQKQGNKLAMCRTVETGLTIYSQNMDLLNAKEYCQRD